MPDFQSWRLRRLQPPSLDPPGARRQPMSATRRPTTLQRRRSSGAAGPRLGAVKLSPLAATASDAGAPAGARQRPQRCGPAVARRRRSASPCRQPRQPVSQTRSKRLLHCTPPRSAGSPCSTASDASALATPQERSPLVVGRGGGAALPAAADGLAQFSQQLTATRSSDRWLEERLASSNGRDGASGAGCGRPGGGLRPPPPPELSRPADS